MLQLLPRPATHALRPVTSIHPDPPKTYQFIRGDNLPDRADQIWQITSGYVRSLTWSPDGELTTLGIWGQQDFLSHGLSIVTPYQLECLTPVTAILCRYSTHQLYEILLHNIQQTEKLLAISHQRQLADRLLSLLHWLGDRFGSPTPGGQLLQIGMTHQQIAELAGTTRVTATRLLSQLATERQIQRLPKRQLLIQSVSGAPIGLT
jgi:CRP-like cAMP-binding protein